MPGRDARDGLEFQHFGGQVADGRLDLALLMLPGVAAQAGQRRPALRPPHVLLHQADLRRGHVELRPPGKLQFQVLLDLAVFFQQRQAAVAGDAVGDVHHQVALVQLEKAVDHPPQVPPRRAPQIGAVKEFAAAQQHHAFRDQPETVVQRAQREMEPPLLGQPRGGEDLRQAAHLGLGLANQENLLAGAGVVQFVADLVDVAAEALDRFDLQPAGGLQRAGGHGRGRHRGEAAHLAEHVGHRVQFRRPLQTLQVMLPLGLQFARLDQQKPAFRRQEIGEMAAALQERLQHRHFHGVHLAHAPLAGDLEAAERFDLVAQQLHPHRVVPIGGEDVDDAAAERELARQFHAGGGVKAVLDQPAGQFLQRKPVADPQQPRLPRQGVAVRHGLHEGLDAGGHQARPLRRLQQSSAAAAALRPPRPRGPLAGERFAGGKLFDHCSPLRPSVERGRG